MLKLKFVLKEILFVSCKALLIDSTVVYANRKLLFYIYPNPPAGGSEENQFAPNMGQGKQIDFRNGLFINV